jgi:hypothetical protein
LSPDVRLLAHPDLTCRGHTIPTRLIVDSAGRETLNAAVIEDQLD